MSRHSNHLLRLPSSRSGVALIIVLAFVVLLTAVIVAFFSRAMNDRGISNNSANQTKADLFAQGAANTIIGTLKQEILMSSSATPLATTTIYTPLTPASMLPQISGTTSSLTGNPANLLKRSAYNYSSGGPVPMYVGPNGSAGTTGTIAGSAINVSSTTPSLNGRSVSLARWNSVYLLPLLPNPTDSTPVTTGTSAFTAPDWVLVARNGSQPTTWNSNMVTSAANGTTVIGRYAYAIYHEGGLLDVNAAGYPMTGGSGAAANSSAVLTGSQTGYKNNLAFADLTQLPGINTLSASQQQALTYNLVGWRNYASAQSSGTFGNYSFGSGLNYYNFAVSNPAGFLMASGTALYNGQTDHMFESRQELINFLQNGLSLPLANLGCLNYLATFTRDLNQPSFTPNPGRPTVLLWNATTSGSGGNNAYGLDNQINPSFLTTRVTGTFARDDGSSAVIGEPLVKKRFALSRLAWLTYQGPSALRTQFAVGAASPGTTSPDYDMWALVNLYGVSPALLAQGTAANIKKYFGLTYTPNDKDPAGPIISSAWVYNVHNGSSGVGPTGSIMQLGKIAALGSSAHEPDFFELLKAAINVGSLGKATTQSNSVATLNNGSCFGSQTIPGSAALPANYRYTQDTDVDAQIIQIGANIISQAKVDGYPAHIFFDNGSGSPIRVFAGVKSFPYLDYVFQGALIASLPKTDASRSGGNPDPVPVPNTDPTNGMLTNPGLGVLLQIPALWNPHDPNGSVPSIRPTKFRLVADSTDPLHIDSTGAGNSNYTRYYSMAACTVGGTNFTDFTGTVYSSNSTGSPAYPGITNIYQTPPTYNSEYLTSANTNLQFTDVGGALFHEPTILFRAGSAAAGNPMSLIDGETAGSKSSWSLLHDVGANTITCPDVNPTGLPATEGNTTIDPTNSQYLGIYMGAFPLRFYALGKSGTTWTVTTNQVNYWIDGGSSATVIGGLYLTYRLQYQDQNNNWVTYDTKYGGPSVNDIWNFHYMQGNTPSVAYGEGTGAMTQTAIFSADENARNASRATAFATAFDPRTPRFGFVWGKSGNDTDATTSVHPPSVEYLNPGDADTHGWIDPLNGVVHTMRPDRQAGYYLMVNSTGGHVPSEPDSPGPQVAAGWITPNDHFTVPQTSDYDLIPVGMSPQNNSDVWFTYGRYPGDGPFLHNPFYYADADGVVRRGMSAYVPVGTTNATTSDMTIGLPMTRAMSYASYPPPSPFMEAGAGNDPSGTKYLQPNQAWQINQAQSRPLMLNRPFRSVAELGYVFRDTPWKNLDFSTPESGDSALLDVFCINDTSNPAGLVAGKVNLNTIQTPVLAAILSGAYVDDPKVTNVTIGTLSPNAVNSIAQALVARTTDPNFAADNTGPLQNTSELVGKWVGPVSPNASLIIDASIAGVKKQIPSTTLDGKASYSGFSGIYISGTTAATSPAMELSSAYYSALYSSYPALWQSMTYVKRLREAPIRALSSTTQTRVWNLLIDLVAQTGRYPTSASAPSQFLVESEQRYWVHVAIDRFTGQVLDKQIEVVKQ